MSLIYNCFISVRYIVPGYYCKPSVAFCFITRKTKYLNFIGFIIVSVTVKNTAFFKHIEKLHQSLYCNKKIIKSVSKSGKKCLGYHYQRWSRGHKARGQGQGQPFRGQSLSRPRTGVLKAKDQGNRRKCSPKKISKNC